MRTNKFSIGGLIGVHVSSMVNEVIRTIENQFTIFLRKDFARAKTQIKPKPAKKIKLIEQKTTKATILSRIKTSIGEKIGWFQFDLRCCTREIFP